MYEWAEVPEDDVVIRRYMRLSSFLVLLAGNLVQVRVDAFHDASEGAYGIDNVAFSHSVYDSLGLPRNADHASVVREARLHTLATCWYEGRHESFAMWRVFGTTGEAIAIETTVGRLRSVLRDVAGTMIGRVQYEPLTGPIADIASIFFRKRKEYEYEKEVRTLQVLPHVVGSRIYNQALKLDEKNQLIQRIIIGPESNPMLKQAVETVVGAVFNIGRVNFEGQIVQSSLEHNLIPQQPI